MGADTQNFTKTGYTQAMKKALGVDNLRKVKEQFKKAGMTTSKFDTHGIVRERELVKDLHKLAKAGVLNKSVQSAFTSIQKEQVRENKDLTNKEKRIFHGLQKTTKKELLWGRSSESLDLSPGAKMAYDQTKEQEIQNMKTKFGIVGYEAMRANEDLGKKIRLLEDIRHKTASANKELQNLKMEEVAIRERALKRPDLLARYGLQRISKAHDSDSLQKIVGGPKADEKTIAGKTNEDKEDDKKTNTNQSTPRVNTSSENATIDPEFFKNKEVTTIPFTKVVAKAKNYNDLKNEAIINKITEEATPKIIPKEKSDDEKTYGFINNDDEIEVDEE